MRGLSRQILSLYVLLLASAIRPGCGFAADKPPEQESRGLQPMLEDHVARPLRYSPVGTDFVITNGSEFFNRPLYGGNTAFRVDAGDRPEFSFYLPGRGGNLRVGVMSKAGPRWLNDAASIVTRYRPGSMLYEIRDPSLGDGTLFVAAVPTRDSQGLMLQVELRGTTEPVTFVVAFGGVSGERGRRGGDIGCETKPVSEFFQLRPAQCRSNILNLADNTFTLRGSSATMTGVLPDGSTWIAGSATRWNDGLKELLASTDSGADAPIAIGRMNLAPGAPRYLGIQQLTGSGENERWRGSDLPTLFARAEQERASIANRVAVDTPDPFVNAAAAAMTVAADAVWDERQSSFMHGAVAWRVRLLGWRGPYSGDALGWHDRTARHFAGYAAQQNTNPVPDRLPPPEPSANLSRNETALHSNGDMTRSHYDMNLVAVDAFFRHLLWTGDLDFARRMWPVIERHLVWERRLFRREFGPGRLPLYEAYCCIWASDDLAYNGGGAAHSSAYNFYENQLAARVAKLIGADPAPYEREAALVAQAMRRELWLPDRGWFAESKDLLGLQRVHPEAAVWTFYHTIDSAVATPLEAWQMSRFVDTGIPHIALRGPGVPPGNFTIATTSWMPYTWSLNNVVFAESMHTALGYWEAERRDAAMPLFKGALLDSMYLGLCPGNVGMCTYFDAYRRESQRDFADGVGTLSRALVEGLFGVHPDALAGELTIHPGFPASWDHAAIRHPDFSFAFRRDGTRETFTIESRFPKPMDLRLEIPALRDQIAQVTVNDRPARWQVIDRAVGTPRIQINGPASPAQRIVVVWKGNPPAAVNVPAIAAEHSQLSADCGATVREVIDPQRALAGISFRKDTVRGEVSGTPGARTVFARVEQGALQWWQPITFEIRPAWQIVPSAVQDATHLRFRIRNNSAAAVHHPVTVAAAGRVSEMRLDVAPFQDSGEFVVSAEGLLPGSNPVAVSVGKGMTVSNNVINWWIKADPGTRFETVPMTGVFNDRVSRIFRNNYLSPRSPYCSLAVPKQGIGSWTHPADTFEVDDSGLRAAAAANGGRVVLPQGLPFETPAEESARNIAFTSQWENYPTAASAPLTGKASHAYLLMAGSSNPMQSRIDNGEVVVSYRDGSTARLALVNPINWWPIDQDYFIDDFAFRRPEPIPPRVDLRTGTVRVLNAAAFKGQGRVVPGGAATVLDLPLDPTRELSSITVHTLANEVVIGLMGVTLVR